MSIEVCIAHAIHKDLDILEAVPELSDLPMEHVEQYVERYVTQMHSTLADVIISQGEQYIRAKDAAGLCAKCLEEGICLPPQMLLKICQTIMQLQSIDARFILDTDEGATLYYAKLEVEV